jgi:hypothetical protein
MALTLSHAAGFHAFAIPLRSRKMVGRLQLVPYPSAMFLPQIFLLSLAYFRLSFLITKLMIFYFILISDPHSIVAC